MSKKRGFTLIELLVVIAIIALLLAIVMPALSKAKDMARNILCRSNLKSMQLATILYTEANDGKMQEYNYSNGLWINKLTAFLDEVDDARYCPRTKRRDSVGSMSTYSFGRARQTWVWFWDGMEEPEEGSYAINGWVYSNGGSAYDRNNLYYNKITEVKSTSITPVFADSIWVDTWPRDTDSPDVDLEFTNTHMGRLLTYRHEDKTNVGFVDGSQRPVELSQMWSLKWHKEFKTKRDMTRTDGSPIYQREGR